MNHREVLLAVITDLVIDRDAEGSVIDVNATASQLLCEHPHARMSFQEIAVHIETMAVIVGAPLLIGTPASAAA